jgi:hypothetical protein
MDGAYDKLLVKLGLLPEFPLRLLSPYTGFTDDDHEAARRYLLEHHPDWLGAAGHPTATSQPNQASPAAR